MSFREMSDVTRIGYLRSELIVSPTVYDAASRIFVGPMSTNKMAPKNEEEMLAKSVKPALELAITTDKVMDLSSSQGKTISNE